MWKRPFSLVEVKCKWKCDWVWRGGGAGSGCGWEEGVGVTVCRWTLGPLHAKSCACTQPFLYRHTLIHNQHDTPRLCKRVQEQFACLFGSGATPTKNTHPPTHPHQNKHSTRKHRRQQNEMEMKSARFIVLD